MKQCNWLKEYDNGAFDGTQRELKARGKGFRSNCYGSNEYPADFGTFINLLNQVISGSGIQIQEGPMAFFNPGQQ